ncbi:sugar phosphate isomerase/epimerase family protein [Spirosoma spitsbergense]|jgi:sugar phosphate isomerase/epimerase|uniref:sugar phosphate isomerase/epimerase family protein n=1 Tax=Spirosoma spitsbergense TaxID=431554 RepID=UPI000364DA7A|nr:sugar phosphate isomerase/epimerase [Spirosoma spitsbergense]
MNQSPDTTRRAFIKLGALAASATFLPQLMACSNSSSSSSTESTTATAVETTKKVGLQLYTLRDLMGKDPVGTLKNVADIGYKEVEAFGYGDGKFFGKTPKEYAALLNDLGLSGPSGHYNSGLFKGAKDKQAQADVWKRAVDDAAEIGQKYMVWAYLFPQERTKLDDYKQFVDLFNKSAEVCKAAGIQFCYHNHDFEFQAIDGQMPYDILLSGTDKDMVQLELDLYWATFAGQDPVELFKKHPGRFPLWHVKDMEKTPERAFAPVGTGSIDFQRIFDAKETSGMTHYFVEQDVCKLPPLESIAISYKNVEKLKV